MLSSNFIPKSLRSIPLLSLALLALNGCQSVDGPQQYSQLRVIDAALNAPPSDLLVGANTVFSNLSAPTFSNYAPVSDGNSALTLRATGTAAGGAPATLNAIAGQQYSMLLIDTGTTYATSILRDQSTAAPAGDVSLRFITNTPVAGALDIYLVPSGGLIATASPVLADVAPGAISTYLTLPAGDYDVIATAAGTASVRYTSAGMTFSSGQVRTLLFMDQKYVLPPAVTMIVGDDLN